MKRFPFNSDQRIRDSKEFGRILQGKVRAGDARLLLYAAPNSLDTTRFGLCVSRKFGSAVKRVAVKRLLREAFRLSQHDLPKGLDLVVIPQRAGVSPWGLCDYQASLVTQAQRLARRIGVRMP